MIVQIRFRSLEEASAWFRDAREKGAMPAGAGLRCLEMEDIHRDRVGERYIVAADPGSGEWRVPPK